MKAKECAVLLYMQHSFQSKIPIYQRTYSWKKRECARLWNDIIRAGTHDEIKVHFIGSVVYIDERTSIRSQGASPAYIIDGQQRLTTLTLLLVAFARALGDIELPDDFSAENIYNFYVVNAHRKNKQEGYYRLVLTQTDDTTLRAIIDTGDAPLRDASKNLVDNFKFFNDQVANLKGDYDALRHGLRKLMLVDVCLERGLDNPQLTFESLNSTGLALSQADLVRNYLLMDLEPSLQETIYEDCWRPMETGFGQEAYAAQFDSFMRHYLTMKTGSIPNIDDVYRTFKDFGAVAKTTSAGLTALAKDLSTFAHYYCAMALKEKEPDRELRDAFSDLRDLKVDVAYPLLLDLYHDYVTQALSKDHFLEALRLVESYVFRRLVCEMPTNSHNKTFSQLARNLDKSRTLESLKARFALMPSYRHFPNDDEFKSKLQTRDMYNIRNRAYWPKRLENFDRKERVDVQEYSIEHIMPQSDNLSPAWKADLGPDWKEVQTTYLHRLGNLTLTRYNSEYSKRPFLEKRDMENGFAQSPVRLNEGLGALQQWNKDEIDKRGKTLAARAVIAWPAPDLDQATLSRYVPKAPDPLYDITSYEHLQKPTLRALFDGLSAQILAIDPAITQNFTKLYIAFKVETNIVDVTPLATKLVVSLNMPFPNLVDPRDIAKDMTDISHWGNGDVQFDLSSEADIPYALSLIRQSLDYQIND